MTVMNEVRPRREVDGELYKPTVFLRTIWRRTLSFKKRKTEDRFAAYKGVRDITIKKGPTGLGIMIIEGRHTEAGRGIFVSDLQEGSAAEQAGLQIGDMILAVNRDSLLSCSYEIAAAKLKHTEGVVVLTVCSPNMKDGDKTEEASGSSEHAATTPTASAASRPASRNQTPDPGALVAAATSRPQTPRPTPSPIRAEPPPDPATAPIVPNQESVIEIATANNILGLVLVGGSDTLVNGPATVVLDIYKTGAVGKDGRLKVGDQIREANGVPITQEMVHERICMTIKQRTPKLKLTVYRPEPIPFDEIEVELSKKPGRALGLTYVVPIQGQGVYLSDPLSGSPAEQDGRLQKGDLLISVDGKDVDIEDHLYIATMLKLCGPRAVIKVKRYRIVR